MLSGIGPRDRLRALKIDVIEDLPVGYNLQDHVSMSALTFLVNESVTIVEPRLASNLANTFDYFVKGTGPLTVPGGAEALAFVDTRRKPTRSSRPDGKGDPCGRVRCPEPLALRRFPLKTRDIVRPDADDILRRSEFREQSIVTCARAIAPIDFVQNSGV